jgi:hypothetical protein
MFREVVGVITDVAVAIERHDEPAAMSALDRARHADAAVERLRTAVMAAQETLRLHVRQRQRRDGVRAVDLAVTQVDYMVRNVRVLARAGVTLARLPVTSPPELSAALRSLAVAVSAVDELFAAEMSNSIEDAQRHAEQAEAAALDAVRTVGRLLTGTPPLALVVVVAQVRATAIDLLRAAGGDDTEVLGRVDDALGLPPLGDE